MRGLRWAARLCAVLMLGLSGCASPYDSSGLTGGYSEQQLEPGIWRVRFDGNGYTTPETVQTFWLYRCAELAKQQGYDGFEILSNLQLTSLDRRDADTAHLRVLTHGGGGGGGFVYIGPGLPKPWVEGDIRLLRIPFAVNVPKVFNAGSLIAALQPIVKGKLCDAGNVCPHVHHYLMAESSSAAPTAPSVPHATTNPAQAQTVVAVPPAPKAAPAQTSMPSPSPAPSAPSVSTVAAPDTPLHLDHAYPNYQPAYPDTAQVNGEQGNVVLNVEITSGGKVRNIKVDQSSGFEDLDNAAIAGVMRWRFVPSPDGSDWTKVTIAYRLPTAIIVPPKAVGQ
jgi:TonB family protein